MDLIIRQLFDHESSTYTYILVDPISREAMVIDPVKEQIDRDVQILKELKVKLKYIAETHIHADHITSGGELKNKMGGEIVIGEKSQLGTADILLKEGDELRLGSFVVKTLLTPGHTSGCTCYITGSAAFTGDTLMIRGCGRTDFQEGSSEELFDSVRKKLFTLPDVTTMYPGHDYKGRTVSTIGEEKEFNLRLNLENSKADFVKIMSELKLSQPKKIDVAVPANLKSGLN